MLEEKDLQAIAQMMKGLETRIDQKLKPIQEDISGLKSGQEAMRTEISGLKSGQEAMRTEISGLKSGQEAMRTEISGIKDRLDRVEDRAQQTAVLLEADINRKLDLLFEGHDAIMERLDQLAAKSELELLRSDMDMMKLAMRSMSQEIAELKKAQ